MHNKYLFTLFISLLFAQWAVAQSKSFGKVDKAELQMKVYPKDSAANAVILFDRGHLYIERDGSRLFIIYERHTRIKILKKDGYEWGDVEIPFYTASGAKEKISRLKAATYTLENGRVTQHKVALREIITEKTSEKWSAKKISMPNIKEGVIIEYAYKKTTPFSPNPDPWYFQTSIPVIYSEFKSRLPTGMASFVKLLQGNIKIEHVTEKKPDYKQREVDTWTAQDIPKFEPEKYMTQSDNHVTKLEFQLKRLVLTWRDLDDKLIKHEYFGRELKRDNFGQDILDKATKISNPKQKAQMIYDAVRTQMLWNKKSRFLVSKNLKKIYKEKKGNSADINLLLINLLRRAGVQAFPILVSTRSHEKINLLYPLVTKFNYVIAIVAIGDKGYFLDATDKLVPFGLLPYRCLNGAGRLITGNNLKNYWFNVYQGKKYLETVNLNLSLNEDGVLEGSMKMTDYDYSALATRKKAQEKDDKKDKEIKGKSGGEEDEKADLAGLKVLKAKRLNMDDIYKPIKTEMEVKIEDKAQKAGQMIYLNPMLYWQTKESPFKLKTRQYPVDFGYNRQQNYYLKLKIPKGYKVESLPKDKGLKLPFKGASYFYSAKQYDDHLVIVSRLSISRPVFDPTQYLYLKEFFAQLVEKEAEQIVLKKE